MSGERAIHHVRGAHARFGRLLLLAVSCAVLGFVASPGTRAVAASVDPSGVVPTVTHHRAVDAVTTDARIDVVRHALDRSIVRRAQTWASGALLVVPLVVLLAATSVGARGIRSRGDVRRRVLPARAPPLPAVG